MICKVWIYGWSNDATTENNPHFSLYFVKYKCICVVQTKDEG